MSNAADALAALKAAEADLEAALAAEKVTAPADPPQLGPGVDPPSVPPPLPGAEKVAATVLTPTVDKVLTPRSKPKYLDMGPGYLGPTAINGT